MNGIHYPFGARLDDLMEYGHDGPALSEDDLALMQAEGLMPFEFQSGQAGYGLRGYGHGAIGPALRGVPGPHRRVLENEERMRASLPDTPESIVSARGQIGESFRTLLPNNLGNANALEAGMQNQIILQARGLDCLTPIGVMLGYEVQGQSLNTDDVFVQAKIKWGVGGAQHIAWVDVGRGTQLRISSASFLEVSMSYLPDQSTTPLRSGPQLMGIALAGYGTPAFRNSPARYTQRLASINTGSSSAAPAPIPPFAQSFGVIGEVSGVGTSSAVLLPNTTNDGGGHQAVVELTDGQMESQYYIPNGFRAIQINNASGHNQKFQIVYTIML
jgi:hypothetical protein